MDLSKIKMVVTDMDGTLLNSKHEVSDRFFRAFEKLKAKNIVFVAASGRQYHSIANKLAPIVNDITIVAENGGFAKYRENELFSIPLNSKAKENALTIIAEIKGAYPVLCTKSNAYIATNVQKFEPILKEYYSSFDKITNLKDFKEEVLKIAIYHFNGSEAHIYPYVQHLESHLKIKVSGANWLDISENEANKGNAITHIQQLHGITPAETLAFGDYNNDLEMLAQAKYSFAMENAHPNVMKAANYNTLSNDNFGVEYILEQLIATF